MTELPLFPLGTVLLPGQVLRLRIFEPRYRRLLADLVSGPAEARGFGVVAIRAGHEVGVGNAQELYAVGCLARLVSVSAAAGRAEAIEDSAEPIAISARGGARFRIVGLVPEPDTPYLVGRVDWLPEEPGEPTAPLMARARAAGTAYRRATGLLAASRDDSADASGGDPDVLVAALADDLSCPLARRQELLEAPLRRRLELVAAWAERETALTHALGTRPAPARPGGFNPN